MTSQDEPQWLEWAKQLQSLAQIGLTYTKDQYDIERYEAIRHIAAQIMASGSGTPVEQIGELFANQTGYATPKVDVRGIIFQDDTILLVKELEDGRWTLPGGWADVLESPREAVEREVFEESGFQTRATKMLAVFDRSKHAHVPPYPFHIYKLFIRCEITGGAPTLSNETGGAEFFREDALPELSISRITEAQIHRFFEHYRNADLPTDFD
ncbi:NUDIX domain-containing protein [bacterium]|nr:MAG: NUDIX domain-containing protein [bacterium]